MLTVYVLELENNKYYVGKTDKTAGERYNEHLNGNGSQWTKKYKPIRIIQAIQDANAFDEDKMTKEYMNMYGIDNVRGGTYAREFLSPHERLFIQREIWMANNCCTRCGRNNHFVTNCRYDYDVNGNVTHNDFKNVTFFRTPTKTNIFNQISTIEMGPQETAIREVGTQEPNISETNMPETNVPEINIVETNISETNVLEIK